MGGAVGSVGIHAPAPFALLGGMKPSKSSLDRLPKQINRRWEPDREMFEELVRETEHVPDEAVVVAVSLDGVSE